MYKNILEVNDASFSSLYGSDVASLTHVRSDIPSEEGMHAGLLEARNLERWVSSRMNLSL